MFNKKLKAKIFEVCGTQSDFAEIIKIDEPAVSRVIRGRRTLSEAEKTRWAKALDCEPTDIFEYDNNVLNI